MSEFTVDTFISKGYSVKLQRSCILPSRLTPLQCEQGDFKNVTKITSSSRNRRGKASRHTASREWINEWPRNSGPWGVRNPPKPLESGIMPGESRAAHVRLAPVLSEITGSFDHDIHEAGCMPLIFLRDPEEVLLTLSECNHCRSHLRSAQSSTNKYIVIGNKI